MKREKKLNKPKSKGEVRRLIKSIVSGKFAKQVKKHFGFTTSGTLGKTRYEQERAYEKQSYIRLRGRFWYQFVIFALYVLGGITLALVVGTFANAIWYILRVGLLGSGLSLLGVTPKETFSWDYLRQYAEFSLSGGVLQGTSWVVWLVMIIAFGLILRLGIRNWYDWVQKFNSRTTNQNRWASLREVDRTYVMVPDRNKFYKGESGFPITHISGYSLMFMQLHPLLWLWQMLKGLLGLNRETFYPGYQKLRNKLMTYKWTERWFKDQVSVSGGFSGFYWIDTTPTHAITTGATRSGKDERRGYPLIDTLRRAEIKPNIIDTDAKNEDAKMSYTALREAGYIVELLNIADTDWSESWNPFQVALDYIMDGELDKARDEAMVIVQIIGSSGSGEGGNDIWDKTAEDTQLSIILILLWLAMENDDETLATPAGVPQFINSMNEFNDPEDKNMDGLTQYFNMLRQLDPIPPIINEAILKAGSYLGATGDTKSSVMFTLQSRSSLFASETVARLTSRSTIKISDYGFPRMMKVTVPTDYAGETAKVNLYNRATDKMIEEDSVKVSRSGVIQYPFHAFFPDEWLIRITFSDTHNAVHLRNSWIEIPGEQRVQRNLDRTIKVDPYSKKALKKNITLKMTADLVGGTKPIVKLRYSEAPHAMFIVTPQSNDNYAAIASLFLGQVFSVNTQIASDITRRKMDRRIIYKLNEFSMFPRIPGFDNFLTRGLTYGHIVDMYVQDDVQVTKHYSESEASEIMNNMLTQFHILSKDAGTNEAVSKRLGEIEIQKELVNSQMGSQQQDRGNRQLSIEKVPLMAPKELEELNDGEMIVLRTAKRADKKWRRIRALPIFDNGPTIMPNRRDMIADKFRLDYYTTDLHIKNNTKHLKYEDIFQDYKPYFKALSKRVSPDDAAEETADVSHKDTKMAMQNMTTLFGDSDDPEPVKTVTMNASFTDLPVASNEAGIQLPQGSQPQIPQASQPQIQESQVSMDEQAVWKKQVQANKYDTFSDEMNDVDAITLQKALVTFLSAQQLTNTVKDTLQKAQQHTLITTVPKIYSNQMVLEWFNNDAEMAYSFKQSLQTILPTVATNTTGGGGDLPF